MCYFVVGHSDTFLHSMCDRIYIFMSTSDVFCHLMFYFVLSFTIAFPHPMCHIFYTVISTWNLVFNPMCPNLFLFSPFGLRSSTLFIVYFILPCPPGMCYFVLCVFSSLTLFFIRCVIGFIFSFYQGCVLLSYALFCLVRSQCFPPSDVSYTL
jgi:hypothetical protein